VRIASVEPWPGRVGDGGFAISRFLVVLADDARRRVLPFWLSGPDGDSLWQLTGRRDEGGALAGTAEGLAARLLGAAGVSVTDVHVDDLDPEAMAAPRHPVEDPPVGSALVRLAGPGEPVMVRLGYALALAVAAGAPVWVADAVLDGLAKAGSGDDLPGALLIGAPRPVGAGPGPRPRFEPRNLDFADGLDRWEFGGSFRRAGAGHEHDYSCSVADGRAVISAAVAEPQGFAALHQTIAADDYQGTTVAFRAEVRAAGLDGRAGLHLHVGPPPGPREAPLSAPPQQLTSAVTDSADWAACEITAEIPDDAGLIRFGVFLAGPGRIELRRGELAREASGGVTGAAGTDT
jgi:hypothetical protein